jgi:hypothetical protein
MRKRNVYQKMPFGPLPVAAIKATLDIDLEPAIVVMSANAQKHASRRHPVDYSNCLPFVAGIVANPLYMGDDFKNKGKIELVGRPPPLNGVSILVAVEIVLDRNGEYNVASFYPVSEKTIESRRDKRRLKNTKKI